MTPLNLESFNKIIDVNTMSILETIGDGISIQDTNFKVLYQNKKHKEMVGDHAGKYCYTAYQGLDEICEGCPVAISLDIGQSHTAETKIIHQDGVTHFEITGSPLKDASGQIVAGIKIVRDITTRKMAEDELRLTKEINETILNSIDDSISLIDTNDFNIISSDIHLTTHFFQKIDKLKISLDSIWINIVYPNISPRICSCA